MITEAYAFADLIFTCKEKIKTLPPYHAIRYAAWLRFACHNAGLDPQNAFSGLLSFRNGITPIQEGEQIRVRLYLTEEELKTLPLLLNHLSVTQAEGAFNPATLELTAVLDPLQASGGRRPGTGTFTLFEPGLLREELEMAAALNTFTLNFSVPLRLTLPPGQKHRNFSERERFCEESFFINDPRAPQRLLECVRTFRRPDPNEAAAASREQSTGSFVFSGAPLSQELTVASSTLTWTEQRYNRERQTSMGGLTGTLKLRGRPGRESLLKLVAGQYLGTGKALRSGLGFYRIMELEGQHLIPLL